MNCVLRHQDLQMFGLQIKQTSDFHPLEVATYNFKWVKIHIFNVRVNP